MKTIVFVIMWLYAAGIVGTWVPLMFVYWDSGSLENVVQIVTQKSVVWPVTLSRMLS